MQTFLAEKQCEFVFNSPSASHAGGAWERQIRIIRSVLKVSLAQSLGRLDDASLRTLFYEGMSIVNSRPLTVCGINNPTSLEPLIPNHLIQMKSKVALPPPGEFGKDKISTLWDQALAPRIHYQVGQFWSRWKREYLLSISLRQKWHATRHNLKVDDIVMIKEEFLPRNQWHLGRVVETTVDSDGLVRRVNVQVSERKLKGRPSERRLRGKSC